MINRVTYSADSIFRLTNLQIQYIINRVNLTVTNKTVNNVYDQSHMTSEMITSDTTALITLLSMPYKKLGYVFYTFCIRFVYIFKKSTVFIRNWSIFRINYTFLILRFLYVFKNLIKNVELKTYNLYGILTNSL